MHAAPSRALLSCLLASCTCGAPADGDAGTPSASSSSSGVGASTVEGTDTGAGGTETGTATTADIPPLEPACPEATVGSVVGERVRRCEVLFEGAIFRAHGLDLDGDGRDSVFIDATSAFETSALYDWVDGQLQGGETGFYAVAGMDACELRWDFDGDGVLDVSCRKVGQRQPLVYPNLGDALASSLPQAELDETIYAHGTAILVDPNLDGEPERLISASQPEAARGVGLYRKVDGLMQPYGPRYFLGGCAIPDSAAYGDFDEDGLDDVVVVDSPVGCDWYVADYDPEFHRIHVFVTRPETETMDLAASVPTGEIVRWDAAPIVAAEMTGDDHVDIGVALDPPGLAAFMAGRGDGTFEDAVVYTATDLGLPDVGGLLGSAGKPGETAFAMYFGQFDDDPDPELVADSHLDRIWVLDDHRHGLAVLEEYEVPGRVQGIADVDGDGVDDLVVAGALDSYLLVSQL